MAKKKSTKAKKEDIKLVVPKKRKKWPYFLAALIILLILPATAYAGYFYYYKDKVYYGAKVAGIEASGKTKDELKEELTDKLAGFDSKKIVIQTEKGQKEIAVSELQVQYDLEKTVDGIYEAGRKKDFFSNVKLQSELLFGKEFSLEYGISEKMISEIVAGIAKENDVPAKDAEFELVENELKITAEEKEGLVADQEALKREIKQILSSFNFGSIKAEMVVDYPEVKAREILSAKKSFFKFVEKPIVLVYDNGELNVDTKTIATWIVFKSLNGNGKLEAEPSDEKIKKYLETIAPKVNKKPKNAVLAFEAEKLVVKEKETIGVEIDMDTTSTRIKNKLEEGIAEITLKTKDSLAKVRANNLNELGITELIGEGKSDFKGSSAARKTNVTVGASRFQSALVAPDEEFSFNTLLGPVEASTGFEPELVILKDKMKKEYGGGLCQVSTTAFRAAFFSGLPITERKNHAFSIGYYSWPYGPGFDATIYPPHPDFRFKNDTGNYILIQTAITGTILTFDFYGTKDGRTVKMEGPTILSKGDDGSMKTVLSQLVYNADGSLKFKKVFTSNYDSPSKYPKVQ